MPATKTKLVGLLRKKQERRTVRAKKQDNAQKNKETVSSTSPRVRTWVKDPGEMDIRGIDTPRKRRKTAKKGRKGKE